jgi:hypothetical protein
LQLQLPLVGVGGGVELIGGFCLLPVEAEAKLPLVSIILLPDTNIPVITLLVHPNLS